MREHIALLVGMVLPSVARVQVQTAMNGAIGTGLRPAERYAFIVLRRWSPIFVKQTSM
jgi:hypothetical protein